MTDIVGGLHMLASPGPLIFVVIGLTIGFLIGLIPGMSSANACAILLPFTLRVSVLDGLTLMVGIYGGICYSMAIPAIMLNIPTEPGAACTALDGYPMARKGRAAEAIGVARLASVTGGIIGIGATLLLLRPLSSLALKFGNSEQFLLGILALIVVGSIVGGNPLKGFLSGAVGLLISFMGANPMTGDPRMDFGQISLIDGVPFIPAVIGLFAISQMAMLAGESKFRGKPAARERPQVGSGFGGLRSGFSITARHPGAVIRSGILGLGLGLIPGVGQSVANFVSYGVGKSRAKNPETWGTGNPEGIICSEGCDNAVVGGSFIPMLALGIPSTGTTAVLLAALTLHGIQPGPNVLSTHGDLAYAVLIALFIANLLILPLGVLLSLPMLQVLKLRVEILIPVVLAICLVGAYAYRNDAFDIGLALAFGALGVIMRLGDYPVVPLLIGLILGPDLERNMLVAKQLGSGGFGYYLHSAIDKVLAGVLVILIVTAIWRMIRKRPIKVPHALKGVR